ncbi:MAG: hypothetical protein ACYCUV_02150 [Phycisphaerae bacterium]
MLTNGNKIRKLGPLMTAAYLLIEILLCALWRLRRKNVSAVHSLHFVAVDHESISFPKGSSMYIHGAKGSRPAGKWFWWAVVLLSLTGLAAIVAVIMRRIRLWKR